MYRCIVYVIIIKVVTILRQKGGIRISKLAQVRKAKGISQARLAVLSGVNRVTIARYETGKISPTIRTLAKLSDALGVKVEMLIERVG